MWAFLCQGKHNANKAQSLLGSGIDLDSITHGRRNFPAGNRRQALFSVFGHCC